MYRRNQNKNKLKLVLASNQSMEFNDFFTSIQSEKKLFDFSGYTDLLFILDYKAKHPAMFLNLDTGKKSYEYGAAYIANYQNLTNPDLAFAAAIVLNSEKIPIVDGEIKSAPSFSKVSEGAKMALAGVPIPKTYGGTKIAIIRAITTKKINLKFPIILKLADGSRGDNNYTIFSENEIFDLLNGEDDASIWVAQEFIENDGFYRLYFYTDKSSAYAIFRSIEHLPEDRDRHLSHSWKPQGGLNATFLEPHEIPRVIITAAKQANKAVNRQFSGIDAVIDKKTGKPYIIEVNNWPQLATATSFQDRRREEFLKGIQNL